MAILSTPQLGPCTRAGSPPPVGRRSDTPGPGDIGVDADVRDRRLVPAPSE